MKKSLFKVIAIFIVGMAGGVFADKIFLPYFIRPQQTPVYVTERKEITNYVQENIALREVIEKVDKTIIGVKTKTEDGAVLVGSGLIVTNDGFLVTLADLAPQGSDFAFYAEGAWPNYQILKRDFKNNLALVKIEKGGLNTAGFADSEKITLGERVFLAAMDFSSSTPSIAVNEGIIRSFSDNLIQTSMFDSPLVAGSPLFNIEGKVVGLSIVGSDGRVSAIPITIIRQFTGF
jgi:S1-C subfamily serine protease